MASDKKITLPSSSGGLMSHYGAGKSRITFPPGMVILAVILVIIIEVSLHMMGASWFGV